MMLSITLLPSSMLVGGGILILTLLLFFFLLTSSSSSRRPPPGPHKWALPIIGNLPHLMMMARRLPMHQALCEMSKEYGPLMELRLGGSQRLVVASSPETARLILQTHDNIFSGRTRTIAGSIICGSPAMDIALADPGPQWRLLRRVCTSQIFAPKCLMAFRPMIQDEVRAMLSSIHNQCADDNNLIIRNKLQKCNNNIMSRMTLGKAMDEIAASSKQHSETFTELLAKLSETWSKLNIGDLIPCLAWLDLQGCAKCTNAIALKVHNHVRQFIHEHQDAIAQNTTPLNVDLLTALLSIKDEDVEITEGHIISTLLDLFVAGTDTSAITVEWALAMLLANPDKMELVQNELTKVIGNKECVDISNLPNLTYLSAVIKETMRMHPVLPLLIPHRLRQSCKLLGYDILADTQVFVNVWAIGHDPNVWDNPLKFWPERFLDSDKTSAIKENFSFLPFGSGKRICPGLPLATLNVEFVMANLLHSFKWEACGEQKLNELFGKVTKLEKPLVAKVYPRLPLQIQ